MLVTPDFSEIKEEVTPGTYKGIIKKGDVKEWPNGGQYVNWEIETFGETEAKNNGRRIFVKTSTSGKGAFVLQRLYRAAVGQALTGKFDTEQLIGKQVELEMAERNGYIEMKTVRPVATT